MLSLLVQIIKIIHSTLLKNENIIKTYYYVFMLYADNYMTVEICIDPKYS